MPRQHPKLRQPDLLTAPNPERVADTVPLGSPRVMAQAELDAIAPDDRPFVVYVASGDCIGCEVYAAETKELYCRGLESPYDDDCLPFDEEALADFQATIARLNRGTVLISEQAPTLPYDADDPRPICEECAIRTLDDPNWSDLFGEDLYSDREARRALLVQAAAAIHERFQRFQETGTIEPWNLGELEDRLLGVDVGTTKARRASRHAELMRTVDELDARQKAAREATARRVPIMVPLADVAVVMCAMSMSRPPQPELVNWLLLAEMAYLRRQPGLPGLPYDSVHMAWHEWHPDGDKTPPEDMWAGLVRWATETLDAIPYPTIRGLDPVMLLDDDERVR